MCPLQYVTFWIKGSLLVATQVNPCDVNKKVILFLRVVNILRI